MVRDVFHSCKAWRHLSSALLIVAGTLSGSQAAGQTASAFQPRAQVRKCTTAVDDGKFGKGAIALGTVWSGVGTGIGSALTADGVLLTAFYNSEREVTVSRYNPRSGSLCDVRLPSQFAGWDSHNNLAVAVAPDGSLHVAGNAHATALFYARGKPNDLLSLKPATMIGRDEARATYPRFLRNAAGELLFMYRSGGSGDGLWLLNRWRDGGWQRVTTLYASRDASGHISAYPTEFVDGPGGWKHVAVVWRRNPDVASNFAVTYARTKDFVTWERMNGLRFSGPLSPTTMDMVDDVGQNLGLTNSPSLILTPTGEPRILYTRIGAAGTNAIIVARPSGGMWLRQEIVASANRFDVRGRGSLPTLPGVRVEQERGWTAGLRVLFPPSDRRRLELDLNTLATAPEPVPAPPSPENARAKADAVGMANVSQFRERVRLNGVGSMELGSLNWFAQGANSDRPRPCTPEAPRACSPPPMPLLWVAARN